jgi:hypothetical protein
MDTLLMRDKSSILVIIFSFGKARKFLFPGSLIHLARRENSLRLRQFRVFPWLESQDVLLLFEHFLSFLLRIIAENDALVLACQPR